MVEDTVIEESHSGSLMGVRLLAVANEKINNKLWNLEDTIMEESHPGARHGCYNVGSSKGRD